MQTKSKAKYFWLEMKIKVKYNRAKKSKVVIKLKV
jgi:hypothetical protein